MRIRLLGDAHDATGFALAGVDGVTCRTRDTLLAALDAAMRDPDVGVIMVSPSAAALAPDQIGRDRDRAKLPIIVVLPERS
jgi:vacuolar-type H+-ATPase subunit F/Vma7